MNAALGTILALGNRSGWLVLALRGRTTEELGLGIAIVLTLIGTVLHWQLPRKRMSFEERVKDNEMTPEQAERWIRFYTFCAPAATFGGVGVLLVVLLGLAV